MYGKCARRALRLGWMVSDVAARVLAGRTAGRSFAVPLLLLAACSGTEHVVFIPFERSVDTPPQVAVDAGSPPVDKDPVMVQPDAQVANEDGGQDLDLDRGITFEWEQSLPGQGTCREGSYAGSFTCQVSVDPEDSLPPPPLAGQVAFTLGSLSEQQVLSITQGSVKDPIGIVFGADLVGSLHCAEHEFTAYAENGVSLIGFGTFEATLVGRFDDEALVIDGDFALVNDTGQPCVGRFHVSAAP
jgi:hypothetical protein